jgi:hypothetical protein
MRLPKLLAALSSVLFFAAHSAQALICPPLETLPLNHDRVCPYTDLTPTPKSLSVYDRYLHDSVEGLNKMRGSNGLLWDEAEVVSGQPATLKPVNTKTSPTNIGLDLVVQSEIAKNNTADGIQARKNLAQVIDTLSDENLPKYQGKNHSILFYDWYDTSGNHVDEKDKNVSTVDNINLAIAIWTVAQRFPNEKFGKAAQALFDRIDFSPFDVPKLAQAAGNLKYDETTKTWAQEIPKDKTDPWTYGDFGSEARSIYTAGYALGLFKNEANNPQFLHRAIDSLQMELRPSPYGNITHNWDGAIFQRGLPNLFMNEDAYSTSQSESDNAIGPFAMDLGKKLGHVIPGTHIYYPAAFSASPTGVKTYNGQEGITELVTTANKSICNPKIAGKSQSVFTTHAALILASLSDPDKFAPVFEALENYSDGKNRMYNSGIGFSDGVYVQGDMDHKEGQVVNVVDSLDKGMEATAIIRLMDRCTNGASAEAFASNPKVRKLLEEAYAEVDRKFSTVVPSTASGCAKQISTDSRSTE